MNEVLYFFIQFVFLSKHSSSHHRHVLQEVYFSKAEFWGPNWFKAAREYVDFDLHPFSDTLFVRWVAVLHILPVCFETFRCVKMWMKIKTQYGSWFVLLIMPIARMTPLPASRPPSRPPWPRSGDIWRPCPATGSTWLVLPQWRRRKRN